MPYSSLNEIFDAFACDLVYTNSENVLQQAFINNHKIEFVDCKDNEIIEHCKNIVSQRWSCTFI